MRSPSVVAFVVALASSPVVAQDAAKTLPLNYQVTFENDYVRVTRVHYPPHVKLPGHTHTSLPSAYVYLNDAGPVAFKHIGLEYGAATRPPTVARSYRLFRGLEEIHEVENLSDKPSDFLRVEFKTAVAGDVRTLRGKFLPPAASADAVQQVEFDNPLIRVTRVLAPAGTTTVLPASDRPSVVISLAGVESGKASWLPKTQALTLAGAGAGVEVLRFELKTDTKPIH
jgi:hypothetical protein